MDTAEPKVLASGRVVMQRRVRGEPQKRFIFCPSKGELSKLCHELARRNIPFSRLTGEGVIDGVRPSETAILLEKAIPVSENDLELKPGMQLRIVPGRIYQLMLV